MKTKADKPKDKKILALIIKLGNELEDNNQNYLIEVANIGYPENSNQAVKSFWNALKNQIINSLKKK